MFSARQKRLLLALFLVCAPFVFAAKPVDLSSPDPRISIVSIKSAALGRTLPVAVVAPKDPVAKDAAILFILHGRGRTFRSLIDSLNTRPALLAAPFFIVLPQGEDGWYIDSPAQPAARYEAWLSEVIAWAESHLPVSRAPARTGIAGWSMGGYGAVHFAATHPKSFGFVGSIIGLLDFPRQEDLPPGRNYKVPVARFSSDPALWSRLNPISHIAGLRGSRLCLVLASRGFELTMNENFIAAVAANNLPPPVIHRLEGGHEFPVVEKAIPLILTAAASSLAPTQPPPLP